MAPEYYSDSVRGPRPRTNDEVNDVLWSAVISLVERSINTNLLAQDFPELCDDGGEIYATNRTDVMQTIRAEIPDLAWPWREHEVPSTLAVLDLLQFMHRHASQATRGKHHGYFDHHHLSFDREQGRDEQRRTINRLLARTGMAYELHEDGEIIRLAPPVIGDQLRHKLPPTRDGELDKLLALAITKYLDPDLQTRRDALEKLWDAFERAKTVLPGKDKKAQAKALVDAATSTSEEVEVIESEMRVLTSLGNKFRIRHHEVSRIQPSGEMVDYLFARMYAVIYRLHAALR